MSAPTQLSEDDAKKDYLALCLKMSHAQLYAELMRVHKEATLLVQAAVEQEREACAKVCETLWNTPHNGMATEEECYGEQCAKVIRARGDHGNNT